MVRPLGAVFAQVVVGHVEEAEPEGKRETDDPRDQNVPEDPVRHAEYERDGRAVAVVARESAAERAPDQGDSPDGHHQPALTASVPKKLLLPARLLGVCTQGGSCSPSSREPPASAPASPCPERRTVRPAPRRARRGLAAKRSPGPRQSGTHQLKKVLHR